MEINNLVNLLIQSLKKFNKKQKLACKYIML